MNTRITKVFKRDGKVTMIHCGEWPNITAYQRVEKAFDKQKGRGIAPIFFDPLLPKIDSPLA